MSAVPSGKGSVRHKAVKVAYSKRTVYLCSTCLVVWPCAQAHQWVIEAAQR